MATEEHFLTIQGLCKSYRNGEEKLPVLQNLDLTMAAGESLAITGPSGSGKSTLLNIIGTLDRADSGVLRLAGQDISAFNEKTAAGFRLHEIGFVFQLHHLLPHLTVLENVLLPTLPKGAHGGSGNELLRQAMEILDRVGLSPRINHVPGKLSGGERQRAALVRALINRPRMLLADEPTGSLDRESANALTELLLELNLETGITLLLVTHSERLAGRMGRQLELRNGALSSQNSEPTKKK